MSDEKEDIKDQEEEQEEEKKDEEVSTKMSPTLIKWIMILLGVVIGILGLWFTAINTIRFAIYKEKMTAYSEISEIASKIFNIISRVDIQKLERSIKFNELYDIRVEDT